ncbi:hypothetical protein [Blastococcus atacamensis]|uniref:hypothetical protein n=1 Tax=Blastococcus atacamensis TaxID=2070508 RepID=UPI0012FFFD7F|nr:hypothetical protein [Blastococcus atacamensis]
MRRRFTELLADTGGADAQRVGATVHLHHEGALVASTAGDDPGALATARKAAARLVG